MTTDIFSLLATLSQPLVNKFWNLSSALILDKFAHDPCQLFWGYNWGTFGNVSSSAEASGLNKIQIGLLYTGWVSCISYVPTAGSNGLYK